MFIQAYKRAIGVLLKKPIMLWGLSLLLVIVSAIGSLVTAIVPVVSMIVSYLFACGSAKLYLDGLKGKQVNSKQLFYAFNGNFLKIAGSMGWRDLWTLIWSLVPFAGGIMMIIKGYSYAFVPYIMVTNPEISAFDALKLSMKMTNGKKTQMWLADLVYVGGLIVGILILSLLSAIPVIGAIFGLVLSLLIIAVALFGTIFSGLYRAAFFNEEELAQQLAALQAAEAAANAAAEAAAQPAIAE